MTKHGLNHGIIAKNKANLKNTCHTKRPQTHF